MHREMDVSYTTLLNSLVEVGIDKLTLWLPICVSPAMFLLVTLTEGVCLVHGVVVHQFVLVQLYSFMHEELEIAIA